MNSVKIHLALTIAATKVVAALQQRLVYYPIEISRIVDTSDETVQTFQTGTVALIFTLWWTKSLNAITFALWVGLLLVAFARDSTHWSVHMAGVAILFATAIVHVYLMYNSDEFGVGLVIPFVVAIGIFGLRVLFRSIVLRFVDPSLRGLSWLDFFRNLQPRTHDLLMHGRLAFEQGPEADKIWDIVLPTLQICAASQWMTFWCLSMCF